MLRPNKGERIMRFTIVLAITSISMTMSTAFAGEGAGDPFPYRAPGVTTPITGLQALAPDAFPFPINANGTIETPLDAERMLPSNGAQSAVQSVNSLPPGFENGTAAMLRHKSTQAYEAKIARPTTPGGVTQQVPVVQPSQG
jgi:hypothetical protein